ncbi:MAG: T9SS type A sorting domain-containing protein [Candidatus Latescibacteria bacterium]|nr:T9SS type A sorting domain-containing protein [Candidatus Latescibacterota bacterium]
MPFCRNLLSALFFIIAMTAVAAADPGPGDIWREYVWRGPWVNAGNWQRVTDPGASHSGAKEFLPNPVNTVHLADLEDAVRAEVYIELWGGHAGTTGKALRLNGGEWISIPEQTTIPGNAGNQDPQCYQQMHYPSIALPLDQLHAGDNTFEFTSDGQSCYSFGWGQWGVYGVTFRIYYSDAKPHPTGRITAPLAGAALGDTLYLEADASSSNDPVVQVDFIGRYRDFDYEGNGVFEQWHYNYRYGRIARHLGTAAESPYAIDVDLTWWPDQPAPMQLMARIRDATGINYMTPTVGDLHLTRRSRSVHLYAPHQVPPAWQTRARRTHRADLFIGDDLTYATDARLALTTWSGAHASAIGINDSTVVARVGRDHNYSFDMVPVDLELLQPGLNTAFTYATTSHHGIEVLWPGIVLLVEYRDLPPPMPATYRDLPIFADGLAPGWALERPVVPLTVYDTAMDTVASDQGGRALALTAPKQLWSLTFTPPAPVDTTGYRALRLAFHPTAIETGPVTYFVLEINGRRFDLLDEAEPLIDLAARPGWQVAEIPLERLPLAFPYLTSLRLTGAFTGDFMLDDIRLVATSPPTAVTATAAQPDRFVLHPNAPNPFNGQTAIRFALAQAGPVELTLYNLAGQKIATLMDGVLAAGAHALAWDGRDDSGRSLASGVYLYRLRAGDQAQTRRLLLLR